MLGGTHMLIKLAREMGFCFGVKHTIKVIDRALQRHPRIATLGTLVHNPQVVEELARRGAYVAETIPQDDSTTAVAITAHGAGPQVPEAVRARQLELIDTTCPLVTEVQQLARQFTQEGYWVVVYGDSTHPEVKGVIGWAGENSYPATSVDELPPTVPNRLRKVAIISQTTRNVSHFFDFAHQVMLKYSPRIKEFKVHNTICRPTIDRQDAVVELARQTDLVIVVGGRESANTRHLAELALQEGTQAYHIERPEEIDPSWLQGIEAVGVTAGASTPDSVISAVIDRLCALRPDSQLVQLTAQEI
jgi:4-hydroxy-3-methylbut-2-enyl diphosphate reductase